PRRRREGAGGALLEEFRFRAYMEGKRLVQLEVRESNSEAVSFYSRRGFAPVARLDGFYTDGSRALRMVCPVLRDS
ncbi:MAG: GNAT family N-acetyltransferase, partial [Methanomassiliicoccaceae archaeon]|nr:GNAT family N-acetyltransferase [Methanomassiliicoccaceae archaeon]